MIYILVTGEHPFAKDAARKDNRTLFGLIISGPFREEPLLRARVSPSLDNLLRRLLEKHPSERIDAMGALQMDWLRPSTSHAMTIRPGELTRRISHFHSTSHFEKVVLVLVAHQANLKQVEDMRTAFMAFDKNGDGSLSSQELRQGLATLGEFVPQGAADTLFKWVDENSDTK